MKTIMLLALVSVVIFCIAGCHTNGNPEDTGMPDPYYTGKWVSIKKVNMTYGTEEIRITLYKPHSASFTFYGDDPLDAGKLVGIKANNNTWTAEISGYVSYDDDTPGDAPFVDAYYHGAPKDDKYDSYEQEITDLNRDFQNQPLKVIRYSYKETGSDEICNECFIGFEFQNTKDSAPNGKGLMGIRFSDFGDALSERSMHGIFSEMFYPRR